jgi:hypothetical protein
VRIVGGVPIMRIALPNEIVDSFLFLGSDRHARDATALRNLKITHILNCAHDCENHFELRPNAELPRLHYLHLNARDAPTERISVHFQQSFEFIGTVSRMQRTFGIMGTRFLF